LFIDIGSKRVKHRIDYETRQNIEFESDDEAARTLGVSKQDLIQLRDSNAFSARDPNDAPRSERSLPSLFDQYPLPQSSYSEFAKSRPWRVQEGYDERSTTIEEYVGAYQVVGDRIWFGKQFYDGEGYSGVGGVGYLEATGRYTFLPIPDIVNWSTSAILTEGAVVWLARVAGGEGAAIPGDLVRYAITSRRMVRYRIPDVIHSIVRLGDTTFLGTTHGLYVIRNGGQRIRYRMEPDITGRFVVVAEPYSLRD
jgi:hypothetical protein